MKPSCGPSIALLALAGALMITPTMHAADTKGGAVATDPYLWLEEVEGDRAIAWARKQNERTLAELQADPRYPRFEAEARRILEARDRIADPVLLAGTAYNFWQDDQHVRGLLRRSDWASYALGSPRWETVLDVDALAAKDGKPWVTGMPDCLAPEYRRCLVTLSNGGKDAAIVREFDTVDRKFVEGGFVLPEAKHSVEWADRDTLLIGTDWGDGSLTESGYPYIVKRWKRGQPLASATEVFRGTPRDVGVSPLRLQDRDGNFVLLIARRETFFESTFQLLDADRLVALPLPRRSQIEGYWSGQLIASLQEDWIIGGATYSSGSLVSFSLAQFLRPATLMSSSSTSRARAIRSRPSEAVGRSRTSSRRRTSRPAPIATHSRTASGGGSECSTCRSAARFRSETSRQTTIGRLSTRKASPRRGASTSRTRRGRSRSSRSCPQGSTRAAKSSSSTRQPRDGTKVPYFVVRPKDLKFDSSAPTLLYGYGGFQISMTPAYSGTIGKLWLEDGGVYVLANIRGGGEFGPAWHQAGLKTKRQLIYDDFISVAEDLIARKITSARRLGIMGGSNGGLLMGVMLTQRPDLWNAVVIQVPLLDMLRYDQMLAGASWVDEFGSPSVPEERAFLQRISPYQNLKTGVPYPPPFFVTSTKDDRVHPGHARKMAARMAELGLPFYYYENIDGGHAAAADQRERAKRIALEFTYLSRRLKD